jgi:3-deoxy-D-manno-octulosonic-acid transferase
MLIFYILGIKFYYILIYFASFFNVKANLWINGRENWRQKFNPNPKTQKIWFHFASLGEFEQGKPLLNAVRNQHPEKEIVITFFSPSGYEIRKNSLLGDYILYLPIDSAKNANDFIELFRPEIAVFNKYEYWYFYFKKLSEKQIPLYVTSAIFRPKQLFFKFYGGFNRKILNLVTHFFVQNEESIKLLKSIGLPNATLSGDTRFDSVLDLVKNKKELPEIAQFKGGNQLLIAGSTWPEDEDFIVNYIDKQPFNWKFIIAPHEISEAKLLILEKVIPVKSTRYSKLTEVGFTDAKVLIIDNIGMLSSLYAYGEIAFIGGGFGAGIHNILEAAAWGLPVIFGPSYDKFQEAKDLVELQGGFTVANQTELNTIMNQLMSGIDLRKQSGEIAKTYVAKNTGATEIIMKHIFNS